MLWDSQAATREEGPDVAAPPTAGISYQTYDSTSPWMTPISNISATSFDAERKRDVLPFLGPAQMQICEQINMVIVTKFYVDWLQSKRYHYTHSQTSIAFLQHVGSTW